MSPNPEAIFREWNGMIDNDLQLTIRRTFDLPSEEEYIYAAESFGMTLAQIQEKMGTGQYRWHYRSHDHQKIPVLEADITAYTSIFASTTDTSKALTSFSANAKKESPRALISAYLLSRRLTPTNLKIPKLKQAHRNPYYDIWTWSCHETGFLGPLDDKTYANPRSAKLTHPMLPVLYHHFGCVCPSYEALTLICKLCTEQKAEGVLDMASGNGYWTYMLRLQGVKTIAVDNMEASWRYNWIEDTVKSNGTTYLKANNGAKGYVLLMVYMVTKGDFTRSVLRAYKGDIIVIAGTQNANRFTGFGDTGVEEYFEREMPGWALTVRIALPSFAGKDDGMFVYKRIRL